MIMAKDKFYFGKLDKWVSEKILEESWLGVILSVCLSAIIYAGFFWLPEIALFFGGATTPHQQTSPSLPGPDATIPGS